MPSTQPAAPLTDVAIDSLTGLVENYVRAGLDDFQYAVTDLPGFVADTGPIVAAGQPTRQIVRAACRTYARGGGPQNLPGFDGIWSGICGPYLDSIGETPVPGGIEPYFQGGQCPGVQYRVVTTFRNGVTGAITGADDRTGPGPVQVRASGTQAGEPGASCGDTGQTYFGGRELVLGGIPRISWGSSCGFFPNPVSIVVTRVDGQPDDCGSQPPLYRPPVPRPGLPTPPATPIDIPGIGPVNIDVTFDPDGNINIDLPDVGVDVNIPNPFGGGDDVPPGGGGGGGAPPGDVGDPGGTEGTGPGGDADGEAPEGTVLTGLRIDFAAPPVGGNEYAPGVYRGVCYVYMGTPEGLDHDPAGAMLRDGQFVFAERDNLTRWAVSANMGYSLNVTPYYRSVETEG